MPPELKTERLLLRAFTRNDIESIFAIYSDAEVNRFLPWYPLRTLEEAGRLYEERYAGAGEYRWAVCLRDENVPVGYVHVSADGSHDLGYALGRAYWGRGLATEACRAVIDRLRMDGVPFVTATHDVNNPGSGRVMQKLGMRYQYTYREQWQPKNIPVQFRLYQLNLDGNTDRVYRKYWELYPEHHIEKNL